MSSNGKPNHCGASRCGIKGVFKDVGKSATCALRETHLNSPPVGSGCYIE